MDIKSILAIPLTKPEQLFPKDTAQAVNLRNTLLKKYHPDVCKEAQSSELINHIIKLYDSFLLKISENRYGVFDKTHTFTISGIPQNLYYNVAHKFPLGNIYYSPESISWVLDKQYKTFASKHSLLRTYLSQIKTAYNFIDIYNTALPAAPAVEIGSGYIIDVYKQRTRVLLADIVAQFEVTGVAWLLNRIYAQLTAFHSVGIAIGDISETNIWVDPTSHKASFINGLWFASTPLEITKQIPKYAAGVLPSAKIKNNPKLLDLYLVKRLGRQLIKADTTTPMVTFLKQETSGDVEVDHANWKKVLKQCFGEPKFVVMNVDFEKLYNGD